jgi:para-aminobenzoate synthetase component I
MIDFLNKEQAVRRMNEWGSLGRPFFFLVDFEMVKCLVLPLDALSQAGIRLTMPGASSVRTDRSSTNLSAIELIPSAYSFEAYKEQFCKVVSSIRAGDSFLVNLTCQTPVQSNVDLSTLYDATEASYKLLFEDYFLVFSPETFVRIRQGVISSCPMKGTLDASLLNARELLLNNPKEAAEHSTIVDLIRNDLSIVATDVQVSRFRYIDEIQAGETTLLQVSSEITGNLPTSYPQEIGTILFSLLPAGSVTGAPKKRTVEIIRETERYERGFYTGIFGTFDGINLDSAVAIRFLEQTSQGLVYKSGGGITAQSNLEDEYNEMIRKIYVPTP